MKNKWLRIADWLDTIAVLKIKDWECEFPPNAVFPPDELDESVSAWCRIMAKDMTVAIYPPEEVQPWILARLVSCASKAKTEAERGDSQPDMPDRAALEAMLVDQWHGELRQKWIMAIKDGKP